MSTTPRAGTAADVAEIVMPGKKFEAPDGSERGNFLELSYENVVLKTVFSRDWSLGREGRQTLLTHKDKNTVCQSIVVPRAEYDGLIREHASLPDAQKALMIATLQAVVPAAEKSADVTSLFQELGPPNRIGNRVTGTARLGGKTMRLVHFIVWVTDKSRAATLTCSQVRPDAQSSKMLGDLIAGYKFK